MLHRLILSFAALAITMLPSLRAQSFNAPEVLKVELQPSVTAVAPGQAFTMIVKLQHAEHAHSYWRNPGGPGKPMKLKWTLPEGFTAGETEWPAPYIAKTGDIINFAFEGETLALASISVPASAKVGESLAIEVLANGQVCSPACQLIQVKASLSLPIAAAATPAPEAAALIDKARKAMPTAITAWAITASNEGGKPALHLQPQAGASADLKEVFFFSDTEVIDSQKPQQLSKQGSGWRLDLPAVEGDAPTEGLSGILSTTGSWLADKPDVHAFTVSLPFAKAPAAAATSSGTAASDSNTASTTQQHSVPMLLLFAFLGGLILNVMPCVFPVLGIKIMGFVQQAGSDRRKVFLHGLAYTAGVLLCFWVMALLIITLGKGWGAQLQSHGLLLALCYFFLAFGLNMAGVFEVGSSAVGVGQGLQKQGGYSGSFFSGLLATIVATPCSAPFLGPALAWALSLPPVMALLVFTIIGLGLSSPYLLLSLAPNLVKMLPRPGAWMESFKQGMSFLLFATAGYMFWIICGKIDASAQLNLILGMVCVALACWIYGRWFLPHRTARARGLGLTFAALSLGIGLQLGWPPSEQEKKEALVWQPWSQELVKTLRDKGEPVYIDFTARWCATCQTNKHVYEDKALRDLFRAKKVHLLKADWSDENDTIRLVLRDQYNKAAIPVNPLYLPGAKEPIILPEALTVSNVTAALNKISP